MTTVLRVIAGLGLLLISWLFWGSRADEEHNTAPIVRTVVRHPVMTAVVVAAAIVAFGALVVIAGIVPIRASSGHWRITAIFLDFAKTRSVSTYSWGIEAPPLDNESWILTGAAHYETACVPCHGSPDRTIPPVAEAMTPRPPQLNPRIARWQPEELFSIVKHGIKFTGMPAWPAQQRDDEVWAMVAFLRRMPQLDSGAYRRLVYGETANAESALDPESPPRAIREMCSRCHGRDGTGRIAGAFPSLAGQRSAYLLASLRAFRERKRFSGIMGEIATKLSDPAMREIAAYYERLPPRDAEASIDEGSVMRGQAIATSGVPERDIPACRECHGPIASRKNPAYPKLSAQHHAYLTSQLRLLQQRRRGGTLNVDLMHVFVNRLRQDEIHDVARYYATSSPVSEAAGVR